MGSQATIDFNILLSPLAVDSPVGKNLREDTSPTSLYYQIKGARNTARAQERQQMQGDADAVFNNEWRKVLQLATNILGTQSKDLEICAWFIEALLREHGFAGLRDGFTLAHGLCEKFWDQLYPLPTEDDGVLTRIAAFIGLNGEDNEGALIAPIANIPLTEGTTAGPFALWQYQQALDVEKTTDPERRAKRIASGAVSLKNIELAATETSPGFFQSMAADLQDCVTEFSLFINFLDDKCGTDSPPSSRIRDVLTQCLEMVKYFGKDALVAALPAENSDNALKSPSTSANLPNNIGSREEAFTTLLNIANFFRRTEPHSPLSYLIQKTVRWGKMPLPALLSELITDDKMRIQLFTLAGIEEFPLLEKTHNT